MVTFSLFFNLVKRCEGASGEMVVHWVLLLWDEVELSCILVLHDELIAGGELNEPCWTGTTILKGLVVGQSSQEDTTTF